MPEISFGYRPGPGIETVSRSAEPEAPQLPEGDEVPITPSAIEQQLPSVLFRPTLDEALVDAIAPTLIDQSILDPEAFSATSDRTQTELENLIQTTTDENVRRDVSAALQLLSDNQNLRQFLQTTRQQDRFV